MRARVTVGITATLGLAVFAGGAFAGGELTPKQARDTIAALLGRKSDEVRIKSVSPGLIGGDATVEAELGVTFQLHREKDQWLVKAVRMSDRRWEDIDMLRRALDTEKAKRAQSDLGALVAGIEAFRRDRGFYPDVKGGRALVDFIVPAFLPQVVREDPWDAQYDYRRTPQGFEVSSTGPDRKAGTPDDIVARGPAGGTGR